MAESSAVKIIYKRSRLSLKKPEAAEPVPVCVASTAQPAYAMPRTQFTIAEIARTQDFASIHCSIVQAKAKRAFFLEQLLSPDPAATYDDLEVLAWRHLWWSAFVRFAVGRRHAATAKAASLHLVESVTK